MGRLLADDRGQLGNLIRVGAAFLFMLFLLWLFAMVGPAVIEPLHDFAVEQDSTDEYDDTLDRYQAVTLEYAPAIMLVGAFVIVFVYAVFRERFSGPARPPR